MDKSSALAAAASLLLGGCALQSDYRMPVQAVASEWSQQDAGVSNGAAVPTEWWRLLGDLAVDELVDAALAGNPTLDESMARVDEARAQLGIERSALVPSVAANTALARSRDLDASGVLASTGTGSAGLGLGWEVDLFGRVRQSVDAASRRLDARDAEAQAVRLRLTAQVADTTLALRACELLLAIQRDDLASREAQLRMTRTRVDAGSAAPADLDRAQGSLALSRTAEASRKESRDRLVHALAALSGMPAPDVRSRISIDPAQDGAFSASPPETRLALPATVLLGHPSVVAAERELAAAWSDIGGARAARLPRLDLAALLTGQWLRLGGESFDYTARSLSAGLSASLLDGGLGRSNVEASEARYRRAAAVLASVVRTAWRDTEDALAAVESSRARQASTDEALSASRRLLGAADAQWRAGSIGLFELEDARRRHAQARDDAIVASRDRAQAWVALVRSAGNAGLVSDESTGHEIHASSAR